MDFDGYQRRAMEKAVYKNQGRNIIYTILGVCGEAGEIAEKYKRILREGREMTEDDRLALTKELGDVLWYVSAVASELGVSLEDVALANLEKLEGRLQRGTLHGTGDDR